MKLVRAFFSVLWVAVFATLFSACGSDTSSALIDDEESIAADENDSKKNIQKIYDAVVASGKYTTRDSVAAYLCKFSELPSNYVGKNEGQKLYESKTGNTFGKWNFNPWTTIGVMIGGDAFDNGEKLLPEGNYHEADLHYSDNSRGTKRLVYSSPCTIYYTADHYKSYTLLEF